jgi:hypothetical protein
MTKHDEVREQLLNAIKILQPYARSHGRFHDIADLRAAIKLAVRCLERAKAATR